MSKAVLISTQPKWCEKIANGAKTIEVRKSKPKLQTPFKVYIYCTNDRKVFLDSDCNNKFWTEKNYGGKHYYNGKVIGEFVCDEITPLFNVATTSWDFLAGNVHEYAKGLVLMARLTEEEMHSYANGKNCYAWRISQLKIYDKPKELIEFYSIAESGSDCCTGCIYHETPLEEMPCRNCTGDRKYLYRAPQSWCYVEELQNG